jgi:hypothetical protein
MRVSQRRWRHKATHQPPCPLTTKTRFAFFTFSIENTIIIIIIIIIIITITTITTITIIIIIIIIIITTIIIVITVTTITTITTDRRAWIMDRKSRARRQA